MTEANRIDWANLGTTKEEVQLIHRIGTRAHAFLSGDFMDTVMDLEACHSVTPLNLEGLANADDFDLIHDVVGIRQHLNRETGELNGFFLPRFAKPKE